MQFFATCAKALEPLVAGELTALGATDVVATRAGVAFSGTLETAYRACLWSRIASRVLLPLSTFPVPDADALYAGARAVDWTTVFGPGATFAIEVAGNSPTLTHTHYASLKVKDAVADIFREKHGARPDVDTERPDIRIHLYLDRQNATLSLDFAGDSLHRRGYRLRAGEAPMKENLAAAILLRCGWPALAAQGAALLDPMCGSGTLPIEAALMAADIAPNLNRARFGFESWLSHDANLWRELREEATARKAAGLARPLPPMRGQDLDPQALKVARGSAERIGLGPHIEWVQGDAIEARPHAARGLVIANPPYGERLGAEGEIIKLYSLYGATLKQYFGGWHAAVFTARADLAPRLGLRAQDMYSLYNGALPCKLLTFEIAAVHADAPVVVAGGEEFANRLRKNVKHLGKWAARKGVDNYRVYDADLPEYAIAVDIYREQGKYNPVHLHVQEYAAPKTVDPVKAEKRLREALSQLQQVMEVPAARIDYKLRKSQKGTAQYGKQNESGDFVIVTEHDCKLWVNFEDYLDTGLFLDHRPLRLRIQQESSGKRFLNLFAYTCSASVHAAVGGAVQTVSVDLSNTYLEWGQRNLELNDFHPQDEERRSSLDNTHRLLRADCREWLAEQSAKGRPPLFDLILCDPPTFSNSKRMEGTLDTQRDHVDLIRHCEKLLAPGGVLYFSTNKRGFKLDTEALAGLAIKDITAQTLDDDFKRPPPAHKCWRLARAD